MLPPMPNKRSNFLLAMVMTMTVAVIIPLPSFAHPGNTAADGCHYCRTNCDKWGVPWNERHCHRSKGVPQPSEPIRSHRGEPQGYTTPAPDYKTPTIPKSKPIPTKQQSTSSSSISASSLKKSSPSVNSTNPKKQGGFWEWLFK